MVYVPAVVVAKFISPVAVFTKFNPAGEAVKTPATPPPRNDGEGFTPFEHTGVRYEKVAIGGGIMDMTAEPNRLWEQTGGPGVLILTKE